MEYTSDGAETSTGFILCCECGVQIEPNPANMCVACLRTRVDISEGIPKQATLYFCKACERYMQPPNTWIQAALESRELLAVCLKRIKGLVKVRLVDAGFIWTEPHSKRIKVKLSIQKEIQSGAVLQQVFVVEFVVHGQMCDACHRVEAKDYWRACVQIRQKTNHKKTLFYLEQLILKSRAHINTTNIKQAHEGLDFYYAQKQDARKLVDFLVTSVPCRYQMAQELISHDPHSNVYQYKHTFSVEIVPICKDNIVCLPKKLAQSLGNLGQLCVCSRVTERVHLIDPNTLQIADVTGSKFYQAPFQNVSHPRQLQEFIVMTIDHIPDKERRHVAGAGHHSNKHVLADAWVVRAADLGSDEQQHFCRTHLGHLLQPGDSVLGLDMRTSNVTDQYYFLDCMNPEKIPDVILVKKVYGDSTKRQRKRKWKLQHINVDGAAMETASNDRDYADFLDDLEEDPDYRQKVNIYKDNQKIAVDVDDTDDEETPQISLQEMLDDLHLTDATGDEGAPMID